MKWHDEANWSKRGRLSETTSGSAQRPSSSLFPICVCQNRTHNYGEETGAYLESLETILLRLDGTRLVTYSLESDSTMLAAVHPTSRYLRYLPVCKRDSGGLELLLDRLLEPLLGSVVNVVKVHPELLGRGTLKVEIEEAFLLA